MRHTFTIVLACLFLAGCGATAPVPTPTAPTAVSVPSSTVVPPAAAATAVSSATPTLTPQPPPTLTPIPALAAGRFTAVAVAAAFKAAGLEYDNTHPMTKEDYGFIPMGICPGVRFFVPSLGPNNGGRLFECRTNALAASIAKFYNDMGKEPLLFTWAFVRDNIVVQVNGDLAEAKARQYEAVLNALP